MGSRTRALWLRAAGFALAAAVMPLATAGVEAAKVKVGEPLPAFDLKLFQGKTIPFSALAGHVLVLNRWASWCAPCRAEIPKLEAYYRAHVREGLFVVAVGTEELGSRKAEKMLAETALSFAHPVRALPDPASIPMNYVVDRRGVVRYAQSGALDADDLERIVTPLLAEPAS